MTAVETLADLAGRPHATVFPGAEPKTIRLTLAEGEAVAPHTHPDRAVLFYVVEGRVELRLDDETHDLAGGAIARFDGDREIAPTALEASTALVVLARRGER
jgi:quercetin dioxygenase-like cupin family protein